MAIFVHLAPESRAAMIRRNGVQRARKVWRNAPGGIYAMPVTRNFYVSHQWLRELKRRNQGPIAGVYFRLPDHEMVWVGRYHQAHQVMTAAQAVAEFMAAESRLGWQVVIPRCIAPKEICRVRSLPQVIGWRYYPEAKGKFPFCTCRYCTRGEYRAQRARERLSKLSTQPRSR